MLPPKKKTFAHFGKGLACKFAFAGGPGTGLDPMSRLDDPTEAALPAALP
jgi:hypothetical protein